MECSWEEMKNVSVTLSLDDTVLEDIQAGRMTFQRAFMSGAMKMKGDFKILRSMDQLFVFEEA